MIFFFFKGLLSACKIMCNPHVLIAAIEKLSLTQLYTPQQTRIYMCVGSSLATDAWERLLEESFYV